MLKIVDCTIRDGGHLNGWNFFDTEVQASYDAALKSGADYFEIGYRFSNIETDWGKFAKCADEDLFKTLKFEDACKLMVMINAGKSDISDFKPCKPELTPIKAVRVAAYPYELDLAFNYCETLKKLGYEVFLNLMVISKFSDEEYQKLENWSGKTCIDALYFADSFGGFVPDDIVFYFNKLKSMGFEKIGFHSHNNLQLAFANSLKAIELGAYVVDASIYGMGRGAGNLPIEILIGYLDKIENGENSAGNRSSNGELHSMLDLNLKSRVGLLTHQQKAGYALNATRDYKKYNPLPYIEIIDKFYADKMQKTPWGYRVQSLISGLKNIHPYYVESLFDKQLFTADEIWEASELIEKKCPIAFCDDEMNTVLGDKLVN